MDFLDPKKQRAHTIRLFIGYILVAIAIGIGSLLLLYLSFGYGFDRKTGEVIQNGLVFVSSRPASAAIYINGERNNARTDTRLVLPAGDYELELRADGYRGWKRSFTLDGGVVERFAYPFLFPNELVPEDMQLYADTPAFATQSPDRQWLLVQQPGSLGTFDMVNLNAPDEAVQAVTVPDGVLTGAGAQSWQLVEWSTDNRHVLLKHLFEGGFEFILIDRVMPENSLNINSAFSVSPTQVVLRDKAYDKYYFYDAAAQTLQSGDLRNRTLVPVLSGVAAYKTHGSDVILYATTESASPEKVKINLRQGADTYTIRELAASELYLLDVARFNGEWYVAAGSAGENKVYVYRDAVGFIKRQPDRLPVPSGILKVDNPRHLSFSANARFIMAHGSSNVGVYDAETVRHYHYALGMALPAEKQLTWMDGHRLTVVHEGKVEVFDYDGINRQTLLQSNNAFVPYFDRDYTAIYTIGPSAVVPGRSALVRAPLTVEEQ